MANPITVSAVRFRIALTVSLILSVTVVVAVIAYGINYLNSYADEVNEVAVEANNTDTRLGIIQQEAASLKTYQNAAERAQQIVAESQSYQYQDVIIRDLEEFARRAGVSVQTYDFVSGQQDSAGAAKNSAPQSATIPDSSSTQRATTGPKSTTVNITLANPVDYRGLLRFIYHIEQNLTKMQIANIAMTGIPEDSNNVTSSNFIIQVYIR